ncbi:hypothetical protein DFO73_101296 [Cytobacillus oceanisediminis]|uniref:Uncharacterized protein n=1 Tax=Cytobacillus oceanisediminis TaxID=665099 RepID=A0A2V3A5L5_9BACI|nr:hypothetical protein [Cytobacillus oceanisediminis]PWW32036.1 hypothetical protein DFO73_101296 [Cytobacillus oceanisediminis]
MRSKLMLLAAIVLLVLTACGQDKAEDPITLKDQNSNEVTFPQDKPALFFFITTYT